MLGMAWNSLGLFFRGKLFADPIKVFRQLSIGVAVTALLFVAAVKLGVPLLVATFIAALLGGLFQPYLFRNLRYR